ncbi:MAG: hypothetical protein WCT77_04760 [Bacteroidota bacterium]
MSDTVYFNIAGFSIKIVFQKTIDTFAYKRIKRDILDLLQGFIAVYTEKIDYTIEFIDPGFIQTLFKPKKQTTYTLLYHRTQQKIVTFYYLSIFQFQSLLQSTLLYLLNANKGFMVHCSAILIDEKAHVFLGVSGAGKSTIVKFLYNSYPIIADDQLIIRKENNEYYCYPSPYREKVSWIIKNRKRYPLKGMYFLQKSKKYYISKTSDLDPIVKLIFNQIYTDHQFKKNQASITMKFIFDFGKFYSLSFGKNRKKVLSLISNSSAG